MKLLHLADLHLGKRVNGFSMLEDQAYILDQLLALVDSQQPDCVLLCGDVYDKPVPPAEAVQLFDGFLSSLSRRGVQVMLISGNHDSPERLAFGGQLMAGSGVHVAPVYGGAVEPVSLEDAIGKLRVIYPNLMHLEYDNSRTRAAGQLESLAQQEQRTPLELFAAFYRQQNGQDMSREQQDFVQTLITSIWEGEA